MRSVGLCSTALMAVKCAALGINSQRAKQQNAALKGGTMQNAILKILHGDDEEEAPTALAGAALPRCILPHTEPVGGPG